MKKIFIFLIRAYRKFISPLKKPCCRFRPTCSQYAIEAIDKHGAFLGSLMAIARVIRCNPYNPGGYDPVPERFSLKSGVGKSVEKSVCENCEKREECTGEDCSLL
jgi:putative membrane protein insertion efficiency factor